ncbi:chaperone modulator CbpM [Salmonirosea aquatica]|uniref:MerR family transcriptional regulator n=1 Tax=Salmonirosea aquatica TaxID=2654236 RepID=A0A7C9FYN9_9BACT|nr:MerR family transcriptional regulator [Cytophagaceae bacterium SJW1-29]
MNTENFIPIATLCTHYHVETSFFDSLNEVGLIEIESIEESHYIHAERISEVEKIIRMRNDLHLNLEGIDVVLNLLQKMDHLQNELVSARNRLRLYEN